MNAEVLRRMELNGTFDILLNWQEALWWNFMELRKLMKLYWNIVFERSPLAQKFHKLEDLDGTSWVFQYENCIEVL